MKFEKLRNRLKKSKDEYELPSNPINDVFHHFDTEREPKDEGQPAAELPDDLKDLEDTKRASYELIKKKYGIK